MCRSLNTATNCWVFLLVSFSLLYLLLSPLFATHNSYSTLYHALFTYPLRFQPHHHSLIHYFPLSLLLCSFLSSSILIIKVISREESTNALFQQMCQREYLLEHYSNVTVTLSSANTFSYKKKKVKLGKYPGIKYRKGVVGREWGGGVRGEGNRAEE